MKKELPYQTNPKIYEAHKAVLRLSKMYNLNITELEATAIVLTIKEIFDEKSN